MAPYAYLVAAAAFNVVGIYFLRMSHGFSVLWAGLVALLLVGLTQWLFSLALHNGLGAAVGTAALLALILVGSSFMGVIMFAEPISVLRAGGLTLALFGICLAQLT